MRRSLLALGSAALIAAVALLSPTPVLSARATTAVVNCAYTPSGTVNIDVGGGINPNSVTFTQVAGTNCSNTNLTLTYVSGNATAGFTSACNTASTAAAGTVDVWACGGNPLLPGKYTLRVITGSTTVQTITIQIVV